MKIVNELPQKSKYAKYLKTLEPGKGIGDLNFKTAEGLRQYLYKKGYMPTMRKQKSKGTWLTRNGLYTVGIISKKRGN